MAAIEYQQVKINKNYNILHEYIILETKRVNPHLIS
jgi:hypothetical protein